MRFLGLRVYWAAVVATALRGGLNGRRAPQLSRLIAVPKRPLLGVLRGRTLPRRRAKPKCSYIVEDYP